MQEHFNISNAISEVRAEINGRGLSAHVMTFGCQQNEADSERARGILREIGYAITDTPQDADLIIVNTCAIREHAEMKALSMLGNFKKFKTERPELIVGVIGCMSAEGHVVELIKNKFHYVAFTMSPGMLHLLPTVIRDKLILGKRSFIVGDENLPIVEGLPCERSLKHKAWVSIMYGCNNYCSYCIVPYTRGRERSRDSGAVIAECEALIKSGVREITLLGQNVNSYKSDMDFATLLERIAQLDGDFRIRFMTSHPKDVSDRLIEVMAEYTDKIAPYFHLPLQSGSDKILAQMNRTYTRERFLDVAARLRRAIPDIALSTDVIIGFPGETEEDFDDTLDVLRQVGFDLVYAFKFSPRRGTPAALMSDTVSQEVEDERMSRLLKMQDEISLSRNLPYVGRIERLLVESQSKKGCGMYTARTASGKLVHLESETDITGEQVYALIERAGAFELFGKIMK